MREMEDAFYEWKVLDTFPIGIVCCRYQQADRSMHVIRYNRKALQIIGIDPEKQTEEDATEWFRMDTLAYHVDGEELQKRKKAFLEGGEAEELFEIQIKGRDGRIKWINGSVNWLDTQQICMSVFQDVTEKKQAELKEHQTEVLLEKILSTTKTAIFWKDEQRRFLGANQAFLDYYGFPSVEVLLGKTDEDMGRHSDPDPYKNDELRIIREGVSTDRVPGMCMSHGENRNIVASKAPMYDNGKIVGLVGSFEDVTNEVRQKQEIEELNGRLAQALQAERKASHAKSDFLARMSHDMRTPLTTVVGLCDIAGEHYTDPELLRYFKNIKNSAEYLTSILTDILDMQKLDKGAIQLNPQICRNAEIARTVETIVRPMAEEKHIRLVTAFHCSEAEYYPKVDTRRLQQIVINLLNNAVKYTGEGGEIHWTIDVVKEDQNSILVSHTISDNGPGITPEFQKIMYEPFTQGNVSLESGGSGLGLAIVKKLVDLMGGSIRCDSVVGRGTTFVVQVPHSKADAEEVTDYLEQKSKEDRKAVYRGCRVLICEDNAINAEIVRQLLENRQITVDHAWNGQEAVRMAKQQTYQAILMDIRMPVMNGYEAAEAIRAFDREIPIIALSANDFAEDIAHCRQSGMNAHLAKPIDVGKLFGLLNQYLPMEEGKDKA